MKMINNQNKTTVIQNKALARLSSGLRINGAADEAAGLSISEGMRAQIRGLERAYMNAQDAVSYVQTADGVVQEVTQHVQRMRELTVQSLNDTLTDQDRIQLNKEFNQLQESITSLTKNAQFNGELTSVDQHMPAFGKLQGNRYFDGTVQIISGWNDRLTLVAEPDEFTILLPEGNYNSITDLIDEIDTKVYKDYPSIIFDILPDKSVSVQIENYGDITKVKGPGSFLFYEYELGNPPGMIIGSTDFSTGNNKLTIYEGVNDSLSFYAGATKIYDFKIPAGIYTRDQLIDKVNDFLSSKGEVDVKAERFGDQYIAITSDKYVITGLSGNMIEIDGISSFLYDISSTGTVNKTNAMYYGSARIGTESTSFQRGINDTLRIRLDNGNNVEISLLKIYESEAELTGEQIVKRLNEEFQQLNFGAIASLSGERLKIESKFYGNGSSVVIDKTSPAYNVLFKREETHYYEPINKPGQLIGAYLEGNYRDRTTTNIDETNNTLILSINNQNVEVLLDEKEYTIDELVEHLNEKLPPELNVQFGYTSSSAGLAITLQSSAKDTTIAFTNETLGSSAFSTLFGGSRKILPSYASGTTSAPVPPPEGTVGEAQIAKTSASVTGQVDIRNGITVTDYNNQLSFNLNGQSFDVQLENGTYSKEELISTLQAKLSGAFVTVEEKDGKLSLISQEKGSHMSFSNVIGLAMERFDNVEPGIRESSVRETMPSVTSVSNMKEGTVNINATNNQMSFKYVDKHGEHDINLTIQFGEYTTLQNFVDALNGELAQSVLKDSDVSFVLVGNRLQLISADAGTGNYFKDLDGGLYKEFFKRQDFIFDGYGYSGSTQRTSETYLLGRQALGNTIEIFPNVNEVLTFDIYRDNTKYTVDVIIPPNTYTRDSFISTFNSSLQGALENAGLSRDLMQAQIGIDSSKPPASYDKSDKFVLRFNEHNDGRNDTGKYQIQGVRGTAAYTYFYNAKGDPKPSHVVGITDLSQGAVIEAGVNDEITLDIDEVTKQFIIPEGDYTQDELLVKLNELLVSENTGLIASYDNNRLKFSNREYGAIPIDGFAGSARDFLFFRTERREVQEEMKFQVGANQGQSINYNRIRLSDQLLRINTLTISHRKGAEKALGRLDLAMNMLADKSGYIGAIENRLEHIIKVNEINMENLVSAESRIRDADLAKEMMTQVKKSILIQTNQAMVMHAKALPEGILQLLRN
jgi:flagellin